jgi:hypothetical protein
MKLTLSLFAAFVIGCSSSNSAGPDSSKDYAVIAGLDVKAAIALANEWRETRPEITSSVTPQVLDVKFPDGRELKTPLPAAEMFVAVAPYVTKTHTCATHYPSSCMGELASATFRLTAKDDAGAAIFDGDVTALKNGFFELWLPRDKTITLHIVQGALSADETIHTNADSPTCITTPNLK